MGAISYENTADISYNPADAKYWDESSLQRELNRAFDLCNGCRMCFKYCPSFPSLFEIADQYDADVTQLTKAETDRVVNECYQCKVCYVKCPYTDRDNHKYNLNYPALLQRATHVRARREGVDFRDKMLEKPELSGKMAGVFAGLVNKLMKNDIHRAVMQAIMGIHKKKLLPDFHRTSFVRWFGKRKNGRKSDTKVVLFSTCFVNYNEPRIGVDAVEVFEKNGIEVLVPDQGCCGMPGLNTGDLKFAVEKIRKNVESLFPYAEKGIPILAVNPTCSLTLKHEMLPFVPDDLRAKAEVVAKATRDLLEYVFELKQAGRLDRNFQSTPGPVAYHAPCHLRAQNIGFRSRDILKLIPGADIGVVDECCGHNGTWAMKEEYFEMSLSAGKRAFEGLKEKNTDKVATDCPLAALQLQQGMNLKDRPVHPVQILAKAYRKPGEGGFDQPAPPAAS